MACEPSSCKYIIINTVWMKLKMADAPYSWDEKFILISLTRTFPFTEVTIARHSLIALGRVWKDTPYRRAMMAMYSADSAARSYSRCFVRSAPPLAAFTARLLSSSRLFCCLQLDQLLGCHRFGLRFHILWAMMWRNGSHYFRKTEGRYNPVFTSSNASVESWWTIYDCGL